MLVLRSELYEKYSALIAERLHLMTGKMQNDDAAITTCPMNTYFKSNEEMPNMAQTTDN
jgi:hypothetical protein